MRQNPPFLSNKAPFHCSACIRNEIILAKRNKIYLVKEKRSPIKLAKVEGQFWSTLLLSSLVTLLSTNFCFHHVPQSLSYLIIFCFFFSVSGIDKGKGMLSVC